MQDDPALMPTSVSHVATAAVGGVAAGGPVAEAAPDDGAGFDRARVLDLVARLERDVALVEQAMQALEAGEHRAAESSLGLLEVADEPVQG